MKKILFVETTADKSVLPKNSVIVVIATNPKDKTVLIDSKNFEVLKSSIAALEATAAQAPKTQAEKDEEQAEVETYKILDTLPHNIEYDKKYGFQ